MRTTLRFLIGLVCWLAGGSLIHAEVHESIETVPRPLSSYSDAGLPPGAKLWDRLSAEPLNGIATLIFILAILHTFAAPKFMALSHRFAEEADRMSAGNGEDRNRRGKCDRL